MNFEPLSDITALGLAISGGSGSRWLASIPGFRGCNRSGGRKHHWNLKDWRPTRRSTAPRSHKNWGTVKCLGVDVDDALEIPAQVDVW